MHLTYIRHQLQTLFTENYSINDLLQLLVAEDHCGRFVPGSRERPGGRWAAVVLPV